MHTPKDYGHPANIGGELIQLTTESLINRQLKRSNSGRKEIIPPISESNIQGITCIICISIQIDPTNPSVPVFNYSPFISGMFPTRTPLQYPFPSPILEMHYPLNIYNYSTMQYPYGPVFLPNPEEQSNPVFNSAMPENIQSTQADRLNFQSFQLPPCNIPGNLHTNPKEEKKEESLGDIPDTSLYNPKVSGEGYKSRNVFKSIMRHMWRHTRKNKAEIVEILQKAGYTTTEIEHAFFRISYYNDLEKKNGNKNKIKTLIGKMISVKTIYTYILSETLSLMIKKWESGSLGRISSLNADIYKELCSIYYDQTVKVLHNGMQKQLVCFITTDLSVVIQYRQPILSTLNLHLILCLVLDFMSA